MLTAIIATTTLFLTCTGAATFGYEPEPGPSPMSAPNVQGSFDHSVWSNLLQDHVNNKGEVDYTAMGKDPRLGRYLGELSKAEPNERWSMNERKAFWINAYNAFTIRLILDHPGVQSIKDIDSPWKTKFFTIGGRTMDLDHVEHTELRKNINDPRIHFGIVCASFSCPRLWNHAYTAQDIDKQLDDAARRFINDPLRNELGPERVRLSRIFDWFKSDFTEHGTLVEYIKRYATIPVSHVATVEYLEYDWRLNEQ
ncbi:MAG: DUF547 domain-containing protein [Flavobacteriales bacterium]|nr:DUF547 domain-containing protein [Flavobacteriales bacterium]